MYRVYKGAYVQCNVAASISLCKCLWAEQNVPPATKRFTSVCSHQWKLIRVSVVQTTHPLGPCWRPRGIRTAVLRCVDCNLSHLPCSWFRAMPTMAACLPSCRACHCSAVAIVPHPALCLTWHFAALALCCRCRYTATLSCYPCHRTVASIEISWEKGVPGYLETHKSQESWSLWLIWCTGLTRYKVRRSVVNSRHVSIEVDSWTDVRRIDLELKRVVCEEAYNVWW